jgi:hypothetical protein
MDLFDRIDELEQALHKIDRWSKAYPLDVFPEPDIEKARSLLQAIGKIAREALEAND